MFSQYIPWDPGEESDEALDGSITPSIGSCSPAAGEVTVLSNPSCRNCDCQEGSCSPPARPAHPAAFLPQELTGAAPPCGAGTRARPCAGQKPLKETHGSGEVSKCQAKEFGLLPDRCHEGEAFPCFFSPGPVTRGLASHVHGRGATHSVGMVGKPADTCTSIKHSQKPQFWERNG